MSDYTNDNNMNLNNEENEPSGYFQEPVTEDIVEEAKETYTPSWEEPGETPKKKKKKSGKPFAKIIASALVFGLVAGSAFQGINYVANKSGLSNVTKVESTSLVQANDTVSTTTDVSQVVENTMPSIVSISCTVTQTVQNYGFFGNQQTEQEAQAAGSGIIYKQTDNALLVLTNYHVVEGAKSISVGFSNDTSATATVKGYDSDADLALLSIPIKDLKTETLSSIKVATFGDSSALKVGEAAIAIGNALGYGQSVTAGYISAKDREISLTDKTMTLLQTDAAINPGNSGGALLNIKGEVIGINTVKFATTDVEGMGYAIPISIALPIVEELETQENIPDSQKGYLGIYGTDITETYAEQFNMPTGIYVQSVIEGSPAETYGINAGDIIVKFEGKDVSSMQSLSEKIGNKKSGTSIKLTVKRMNQMGTYEEQEITVTLGSKSDAPSSTTQQDSTQQQQQDSFNNESYDSFEDFFE